MKPIQSSSCTSGRRFCCSFFGREKIFLVFKQLQEVFDILVILLQPELPAWSVASFISPDPGWADDVALPLPLLPWSSSVLVVVLPDDSLALR